MKILLFAFALLATLSGSAQTISDSTLSENYLASLFDTSIVFGTTQVNSPEKPTQMEIVNIEDVWKTWKTVPNYTFGKDRGSLPMIADLQSLHPFFRDKIYELIQLCKAQGIEVAVVESYRTHAKQAEYFGMGRKYTRSAGGKSKHQYGLAVDVVPIVDSVAVWDNTALWKKIGVAGEKLGLRWGGRWRAPYDPAHFEWSGGVTTYQLAAGALPAIPRSKAQFYPCVEDDITLLKKYWEAWETEQSTVARGSSKSSSTTSRLQKP